MLFKQVGQAIYRNELSQLPEGKLLINTINAYSFTVARRNPQFRAALLEGDILLPDGVGIVYALKLLEGIRVRKIAGVELMHHELDRLEKDHGRCFFLGSSEQTLDRIKSRLNKEYPNIDAEFYSPPFKPCFQEDDNLIMLEKIRNFAPSVLFVGLTCPKQELWAHQNLDRIDAGHICTIGAAFDFYAGTVKRSPRWLINAGLEWFYRLLMEPRRLWKRYFIGNTVFILEVVTAKIRSK